jgi:hypothetical protein
VQVREQVVQAQKGKRGLQAEARSHTHHVSNNNTNRYTLGLAPSNTAGGKTTTASALETTESRFARGHLITQDT